MRFVIGGPPHSGKSTLTAGLIERIRERKREQSFNISFMWMTLDVTDNSLNELMDESAEVPHETGAEWSEDTARSRKSIYEGRDEKLVIADAPGKITDELEIVIEPADRMLIVAAEKKSDRIDDWLSVAQNHDIEVEWILESVINSEREPGWDNHERPREGVIKSVSRDEFEDREISSFDDTSARMIRQIATKMVELAVQEEMD